MSLLLTVVFTVYFLICAVGLDALLPEARESSDARR